MTFNFSRKKTTQTTPNIFKEYHRNRKMEIKNGAM